MSILSDVLPLISSLNHPSQLQAPNDAYTQHDENVKKLALQVHRMGHHIRRTIVEQARAQIGQADNTAATDSWQLPETQEEINAQAEAAIRDLFPRIPNFDRQMIIEHSFRKVRRRRVLWWNANIEQRF